MHEHQGRARVWRALTLALLHALACVHAAPPHAPHAPPGRLGDAYWSGHAQGPEEALWRLGGHALDRRDVRERAVVTQTVFSTVVQTQTATTLTTVGPQGSGGPVSSGASAPSAGADAPAPDATSVSFGSSSSSESSPTDASTSAVPVTSTGPDAPGQPTASSAVGVQPVLFLPPVQAQPTAHPTPPAQSPSPQPTDAPPADVPPAAPQPSDIATSLLPPSDAEGSHPPSSSAAAAAPAHPTSAPAAPQTRPLVMAYYPSYTAASFPPERVDFTRYDWVDFAFAVPQAGGGLGWDGADGSAGDVLRRLVARAHAAGKHVKVSVGGWTGSARFSGAVAGADGRGALVDALVRLYGAYALDGIDIDWEYPGQPGADGNAYAPQDTANFLAFLRLLRQRLPPQAKISAAAMTVPWADAHGAPLADASAFAQVLDWILIMNYDTWGSASPPGPNAPLSNACHNSTQASASAVAGIAAWTAAGFPASKIVLGVPSYGYISHSSADGLQTRSVRRRRHVPMHLDGGAGAPGTAGSASTAGAEGMVSAEGTDGAGSAGVPVVLNEDGNAADGEVQFRDLVQQGVLQYVAAWDADAAAARDAQADGADGDNADDPGGDSSADDDSSSDGSDGATPGGSSAGAGPDGSGDADSSADDGVSGTRGVLPAGLPLPARSSTADTLSFAGHTIANVFTGLRGFERRWDACSSTPFLRSARAGQVVAYDDPQSLELKAALARYAGLRGVNMFDAHGDTDAGDLVDAIRRGLGL